MLGTRIALFAKKKVVQTLAQKLVVLKANDSLSSKFFFKCSRPREMGKPTILTHKDIRLP